MSFNNEFYRLGLCVEVFDTVRGIIGIGSGVAIDYGQFSLY